MQCPKCDYQTDNLNSLRIHSAKQHKLPSEDLYLAVVSEGIRGVCKCGCGETTRFNSLLKGYNNYVQGHASRVNNNWGHNETAREKSLKKRRDEGLWSKEPWNRGLSKKTDDRVATMAQTIKQRHGERYSQNMRENRLNGTIPTLRGSSHSQWKGGTSNLGALCHGNYRLYQLWKFPKLQAAGFKCSRCDSSKKLHVHHDDERMSSIIHKHRSQFPEGELTYEEKSHVVEDVIDYHIRECVSGIVLCESCHELEHESLNFSRGADNLNHPSN